ncbi:MAG: AraC family transcriptional regulator [Leadbetterella sp.]|nr:AraC family transcriptional regulator [Leadbetterella sp.]
MEPILQRLPLSKDLSYIYERYESPFFETPWHYHDEFEIVLCDGGFGKKVIGNHTSEYKEGDLILIGSKLPHWFRADETFYMHAAFPRPASIVIQFRSDSFGESFFDLVEMTPVRSLLEKAKFGLEFKGYAKELINKIIKENIHKSSLEKFLSLFEIFQLMAESKEQQTLSEIGMEGISKKDSERMSIIFDQILKNFKEPVSVEDLAQKVNLTKAAFCRYFKARTQKTFVEYLMQVRINHACKLLKETDLSVLEICYESGFNNLSNFNRQFLKLTKQNPKAFRKNQHTSVSTNS